MAILIVQAITSLAVIWYFHVKKAQPGNILTTGIIPALGGLGMLYVVWLLIDNIEFAGGAASAAPFFKAIPYLVIATAVVGLLGVSAAEVAQPGAVYDSDRPHGASRRPTAVTDGCESLVAVLGDTVTPHRRSRIEPDAERGPVRSTYTFGGVEPVASACGPARWCPRGPWTASPAGCARTADLVSEVCDPRFLNPQTGPFFVEGAEPGDTLAVHFRSITPRYARGCQHDRAAVRVADGDPVHGDAARPAARSGPGSTRSTRPPAWCATTRSTRRSRSTCRWIRCTARSASPRHSARSARRWLRATGAATWTRPEMRAGTTCYLGVNVEGALFSLGDGHARQGEGETCGVAVECAMDTVLVIDLVKGVARRCGRGSRTTSSS